MENRLVKLEALKKELAALEGDQELQAQMQQKTDVEESIKSLDLGRDEAVDILFAVSFNAPKRIKVEGISPLPRRADKRVQMHAELLKAREEIDRTIERLQEDPAVSNQDALLSLIEKQGLTPAEAAGLLEPVRYDQMVSGKGKKKAPNKAGKKDAPGRKRQMRYWRNPYTQKIVAARTPIQSDVKAWANEHGRHVVDDWEITEDEALSSGYGQESSENT